MTKKSDNRRHILALSGGKDSAALAVYLKDKIPNLEYVFLDTGHELPETYAYLDRMQAILNIKLNILKSKRDFDFWLRIYSGCLPSPQNRWCTRALKIEPYENYIGNDLAYSYIALRADENRLGYITHRNSIIPRYPFIEDGLIKKDIFQMLNDSGLGLPKYYNWRSRSGCYFCFFQRREEWIGLYDNHPKLFKAAYEYENNHSDGRNYTWIEGETLIQLLERRDKVQLYKQPKTKAKSFQKLSDSLKPFEFNIQGESILNSQLSNKEENKPCLICTL